MTGGLSGFCVLMTQVVLCSTLAAQATADLRPRRIVENAIEGVPVWSLRPILLVGAGNATGPTQFFRITDVKFTGDGGFAVANAGSSEIRLFDATGRHVRTLGGPGRGPGEFTWLGLLHPTNRDLLAVDHGTRQVTRFDSAGEVVDTERLGVGPDVRWPTPIGVLGNGDIIAVNGQSFERGQMGIGLVRPPFEMLSFRAQTRAPGLLVTFPGTEFYVTAEREQITTKALFGPETLHAVTGTRFWLASSHRFEVYGFAGSGELELMIRVPVADRRPSGADIAARIAVRLAILPEGDMRERTLRSFRAMPEPDIAPTIDQLVGSAGDGVWVRRAGATSSPVRTWYVFDADGRIHASIELPSTFTIREIRSDRVIGVWTDDDGVEYVRIYAIQR